MNKNGKGRHWENHLTESASDYLKHFMLNIRQIPDNDYSHCILGIGSKNCIISYWERDLKTQKYGLNALYCGCLNF